jgi:D-sedoheptulose 7-phosphate isomerase
MHQKAEKKIDELIERYPKLAAIDQSICEAVDVIVDCYKHGNKLMVCGNGGSAADALHIVGELMKSFVYPRKIMPTYAEKIRNSALHADYLIDHLQMAFPVISLVSEVGLLTAYSNDVAADMNFAQQVFGQGKAGDVLLTISTSGNSKNVIYAAEVSRAFDIKVIALTGMNGGKLKEICDLLINVPEIETFKIQELHLPVYHAICLAIESEFYG